VQPRNRDRVSIAAAHVNDGRVGRNRRDARLGAAVFQVQMHAGRVLEPAQALRLVRDDALRLLLVVRPTGINLASDGGTAPMHVNAGINEHVFKVGSRAARAFAVKNITCRIHHKVGGIKHHGRGEGGIGIHRRHQPVRIDVVVRADRGEAEHRDGNVKVIGHREVPVVHVTGAGLEGGGQIAGRRRCQQVLALGHVQQVGVAGCARQHGGGGLHGAHVFGAVPLRQHAAVLR
jgi:hypothetical protein